MKQNKYVKLKGVKMYCSTNKFIELQFLGPYNKRHVVRGLGNTYHVRFGSKLGHGTCELRPIPCACTSGNSILVQPWVAIMPAQRKLHYQPVKYCTYWTVLGSFNICNILQLSHKAKSSEEIEKLI